MENLAMEIHNESIVIDAHLDLGGIVYNNRIMNKTKVLDELFLDDFRKAGINFVVAAIFVETEFTDIALKKALLQIKALKKDIDECSDFMLIENSGDMKKAVEENKIGLILSLEGLEPIHRELELLDTFYDLGVRGFGVTWSRRNFVADGSYFRYPEEGVRGGVTPFGIEVIKRADELGMFIDVSHINDAGFEDVFKYTQSTIMASHSNARAINDMPRNLSDGQIKQIGRRNGVIGINTYVSIVSDSESEQTIRKVCDHIDHIVKVSSDKNVGFGFDLCTKYYNNGKHLDVLVDHADSILITVELLNRGYAEESVKNIIGLNFYEYLLKILK